MILATSYHYIYVVMEVFLYRKPSILILELRPKVLPEPVRLAYDYLDLYL